MSHLKIKQYDDSLLELARKNKKAFIWFFQKDHSIAQAKEAFIKGLFIYSLPTMARRKIFTLMDLPDKRFWARKRPADARIRYKAVNANSIKARIICHKGTWVAARRVIIATGEVSGKKLKATDRLLFGV